MLSQNNNDIAKQHLSFYLLVFFYLCLSACGGGSGNDSSASATISISGTITVQSDSDIDIDLNQSTNGNNDFSNAQLILNPSVIGGYLSGTDGIYSGSTRSFYQDQADIFQASLVANQQIQLSLFQADETLSSVSMNLSLLDQNQLEVASVNLNEFSFISITVPETGIYYIRLNAVSSSSPALYSLNLSKSFASTALSQADYKLLAQDFIPGQALVKLNTDTSISTTTHLSHINSYINSIPVHSLHSPSHAIEKRYSQGVMALNFSEQISTGTHEIASEESDEVQKTLTELSAKLATIEYIHRLRKNKGYEFVEPNYLYRIAATTNDPKLVDQWNLEMIAASAAWEAATGLGVTVAVLDTGINPFHEDLSNQLAPDGYDFINDTKSAGDGNGYDSNPSDLGSSFHGSHVAGIIAAQANNETGTAGLAYNAQILPLRVIGIQDTGSSADIAEAILYAAGLPNASGTLPSKRADIINMSFGAETLSQTIELAVKAAYDAGVILIAAAGNSASDAPFYPAAFNEVIGVGAVSNDKERSSFSNFGSNVNLVAPGGTGTGSATFDGFQDAIVSTISGDNYAEYIGTSMAAPHVSAVAALMKEIKTDLTPAEFAQALEAGELTDDLVESGQDSENYFGAGLINAAKSINWAAGNIIIPGTLSIYPQRFGFSGATNKADLSLQNYGNDLVRIISIEENEPWLQITPKDLDLNSTGLGIYLVEVNFGLINFGQGSITVSYQIDDGPILQQDLQVSVFRSNQSDATVGSLFVSLYREADLLDNVVIPTYTVSGSLNDGVYHFEFNGVAPGRYLLSAGTDNDGDQQANDLGEAKGAYPIQSRPEILEIKNQSLQNLDFLIQFPSLLNQVGADLESTKIQRSKLNTKTIK